MPKKKAALTTRHTQTYATAPTKSNVFPVPGPNATRGAGSLPPPPNPNAKPRKSLTRRILSPLLLLTLAFYGVSVPLGYFSLRYRDFLVEAVPGGEQIGDLLDEIQVQRAVARPDAATAPGKAPLAKGKETELTRYAESRAQAEGWKVKKPEPTDPELARAEIQQRLAANAEKAKAKAADVVAAAKARAGEAKHAVQDKAAAVEDKVKQAGAAVIETVANAPHAADRAVHKTEAVLADAAHKAQAEGAKLVDAVAPKVDEKSTSLPIYAQRPRDVDANPVPPKQPAVKKEPYTGPPLPIGFEPAPGFELPRAPPTPKGEIKPAAPPPAPLPLVAPALKEVTSSEPMLGQLASTIDSLAKYVEKEDATVSASAANVLSGAQKDIKSLAARLEAIKQQEEEKLQAQLKQQASKYSNLLVKAEKDLVDRLDTQEEDWKKAFDDERARLVDAYKQKLEAELATQQELIDQRLKEEVVAQGIELQRRWVSEIKMRVEQERGGRLAKLEELESGVRKLEKVARENEEVRAPRRRPFSRCIVLTTHVFDPSFLVTGSRRGSAGTQDLYGGQGARAQGRERLAVRQRTRDSAATRPAFFFFFFFCILLPFRLDRRLARRPRLVDHPRRSRLERDRLVPSPLGAVQRLGRAATEKSVPLARARRRSLGVLDERARESCVV